MPKTAPSQNSNANKEGTTAPQSGATGKLTRYIFVTGGVMSALGQGLTAAA